MIHYISVGAWSLVEMNVTYSRWPILLRHSRAYVFFLLHEDFANLIDLLMLGFEVCFLFIQESSLLFDVFEFVSMIGGSQVDLEPCFDVHVVWKGEECGSWLLVECRERLLRGVVSDKRKAND